MPVNGCLAYLYRGDPGDDRHLSWNFSIAGDEERCLQIAQGQSVVWTGNFYFHPLNGGGGTTPNPIQLKDTDTGDYEVSFPEVGIFGFYCGSHNEMRGAILVVP